MPFLRELAPILIVITLGLGLGFFLARFFPGCPVTREAGFILALCLAIGWTWHVNGADRGKIRSVLNAPHLIGMIYMVLAILMFKGMLEDGRAVEAMSREFQGLHVPISLIAAVLPFIVGIIAGITIAFVGSTFPLIILLLRAAGDASCLSSYTMLAMVSGFMGVLLSPLHLCLLLTNQYFNCPLGSSYRYLWKPCLFLFGSAVIYFFLLQWFCR